MYRAPTKFIDGNSGEFANNNSKEMCEVMSIYIKVTAGKSPLATG